MPHRHMCDALEEMRTADECKNYSYLKGLIEEVQVMANRMENALYLQKDYKRIQEKVSKIKDIKKKLIKDIKKAGGKIPEELESNY